MFMSVNKNITRNSLIQISGKLVSLILGLVTVAIMTRYLGQEGFGFYITIVAFMQFFGILVEFGFSLTAVQMLADGRRDSSKVMSNIMTIRVITSFIFIGLAPLIIWFFPYSIVVKLGVLITAGSFFFITLIQTLTGVFQKELKMTEVTLAEMAGRIFLVGATAMVAWFSGSIYMILAAISIGSLINCILVYWCARKYITLSWAFDFDVWREIMSRSWPIALSITFNLVYLRMDTIILSLTRGPEEVGLYGATYRIVDILTNLPAVYMGIVLPHLTMHFLENRWGELKSLMQQAFDSLMIFAVPVVVGGVILSDQIMVFVAGEQFLASGKILRVLIWASAAIFVTSLFGYSVIAVQKQKTMMWGYLTTAVLTLIGYLIFIPRFGIWGAAWMTVFSEILVTIWTFVVVYKVIKFTPKLMILIKSLISSLIMAGGIYLLKDQNVLIVLLAAILIYFGMMVLIRGIRRELVGEMLKAER
ncbi:TPA: hypothetical protein DF272_00380 [Candidatus Falkowbacteria bacterium]|nr:hypothetical protein [Candidatus Falkowbacteria bacterium]